LEVRHREHAGLVVETAREAGYDVSELRSAPWSSAR
jgi:hypothetical protein